MKWDSPLRVIRRHLVVLVGHPAKLVFAPSGDSLSTSRCALGASLSGFAARLLAVSRLRTACSFAAARCCGALRRFAASPLCGCAASRLCRSLRSPLCFIGSRAARARKFSFIGFARARAYSTRILVEKWSKMAKNGQKMHF